MSKRLPNQLTKNKKGNYLAIVIVIFPLFFGFFALAQINSLRNLEFRDIGDMELLLMDAYDRGEEALFFVDESAKVSSTTAIDNLFTHAGFFPLEGESAGLYPCSNLIYPLWINKSNTCIPNYKNNLKKHFSFSFFKIASSHPYIVLPSMDIYIPQTDPLIFSIASTSSLSIPIIDQKYATSTKKIFYLTIVKHFSTKNFLSKVADKEQRLTP